MNEIEYLTNVARNELRRDGVLNVSTVMRLGALGVDVQRLEQKLEQEIANG